MVRTVTDFPREVTDPDMGIVLADGCRLSARVDARRRAAIPSGGAGIHSLSNADDAAA
ncbi:MAG: hypothetical protein M9957_12560 [Rhodobacteraceae bacterium]|nr:hypothetical protein [Paracoccaceae bacterium]